MKHCSLLVEVGFLNMESVFKIAKRNEGCEAPAVTSEIRTISFPCPRWDSGQGKSE